MRKLLLLALFPLLATCTISNPGPECGNRVVEAEEGCDCGTGASPAGCVTVNGDFYGASCRSNCELPRCGDGIRDVGEACDGDQLGNAACPDLGFTGGTLTCDASCLYDTSGCL